MTNSVVISSAPPTSAKVGETVLPCQWLLDVTVQSTVPFVPDGTVRVSFTISSGGAGTLVSVPTLLGPDGTGAARKIDRGDFGLTVSAWADGWETVADQKTSVKTGDRKKVTVSIRPTKPWIAFRFVESSSGALVPGVKLGLALGAGKRSATTVSTGPTHLLALENVVQDTPTTSQIGDASSADLSSAEHDTEVWEFVALSSSD